MKAADRVKAKLNILLAAGFVGLLALLVALRFDYFYAMNDDTMMKDIMAGILTGTPEGHNIQMLYPISFLLSLCYRVLRRIPWYAIFLCVCHFGCFFLIAKRLLRYAEKIFVKIAILLAEGIFVLAFFLWELVFMQYTVTSGLLAATAVFLFYTTSTKGTWREYWKRNIGAVLLVILAFAIRTEMLLLVFPIICLAGVFKWSEENKVFTKENAKKYFAVLGTMAAGMLCVMMIDKLAYQNDEWKEFNRFFDARTQIYDFYGIPPYEGNEQFYTEVGILEEQQELLENYNFALDETIDASLLEKIQSYAKVQWEEKHPLKQRLQESIWIYRYGERSERENAIRNITIMAYFVLLLAGLAGKKLSYLWKILFLFAVRSGLWLFIIYRNRTPERITHPLYLTELFLLIAMLFVMYEKDRLTKIAVAAAFSILTIVGLASVAGSMLQTTQDMKQFEEKNKEYIALQEYTRQHPQNLYLFDVMSTIYYNETAFQNVDNSYSNIAYLGGWASKSPLTHQKIRAYGYDYEVEALLEGNTVFFMARSEKDTEWLRAYFKQKEIEIQIEIMETLSQNGEDTFNIYQVKQKNS